MGFQDLLAQNGGFWGQNRGKSGATVTPNKLVFTLGVLASASILVKIDHEMRP